MKSAEDPGSGKNCTRAEDPGRGENCARAEDPGSGENYVFAEDPGTGREGRMFVIGVTGGVGSGKSTVLSYLEKRWGAVTIRLDDLGRELMMPDGSCYQPVKKLFGERFVKKDGTFDRAAIARAVFADEKFRTGLDGIIHPAVKNEALKRISFYAKEGCRLFVIEAALLIENHYDAICDEMWYIYAGEDTRRQRLAKNRGYDSARIEQTMKAQLSENEFRSRCDFIIDNDGDFENVKSVIDQRLMGIKLK